MTTDPIFRRYYPDDSLSGTRRFYGWVRRYTKPGTVLLNVGAGPPTREPLRVFRGEVARVYGADIDPVVLQNEEMDEARTIEKDGRIPFDDESFDIALSDFALEHVDRPQRLLEEVHRLLRPGGSFFYRTPNKYHYVSLVSRFTPHWFHTLVANRARRAAEDAHDPWVTYYRMNSRRQMESLARRVGFRRVEQEMVETEPFYLQFHPWAFRLGVAYERTVNRFESLAWMRANILGRLEK